MICVHIAPGPTARYVVMESDGRYLVYRTTLVVHTDTLDLRTGEGFATLGAAINAANERAGIGRGSGVRMAGQGRREEGCEHD